LSKKRWCLFEKPALFISGKGEARFACFCSRGRSNFLPDFKLYCLSSMKVEQETLVFV